MSDLEVELYGTRIGSLTGRGPALDFAADPEAVDEFGLDSLVLSVAVPLAVVPARARRARRQNYFRELLPEGQMLVRLAQDAGVPQHDVVAMLRAYGRDVAGDCRSGTRRRRVNRGRPRSNGSRRRVSVSCWLR
ncbi:hypothetical protein GCM10023216_22670 [Isoptericola chiayiensis]|uniref:HipA N-terminal subdomain 1 domain-containing protein n=1 Tax=Isoptericola chiayiensis TaxID=579446 RepID=A0ABP8YJN2_9MICO|nr:HipA N-terminal domain-containing protein [Isoptericola chiayiensis]NOW00494.1 HipA-like protein [Isoptericola chiayiensis]